ncbi:hypothetical protein MAR_036095, partial [Mya arenaria]
FPKSPNSVLPLFDLVELVDLVGHLVGGVLCLLPQGGDGGLALQCLFLEVSSQLLDLGFPLLVQLHLSRCLAALVVKSFSDVFKLTDTDTLKHTVTLELVEDKRSFNHAGGLHLVGDDTAHKVGMGVVQRVPTRGSFESARIPTTVSFSGSLFFSSQLVMLAGVVSKFEVGVAASLPALGDLTKGLGLAKMVRNQLVLEGLVRCLREHALFFQNGKDTHRLEIRKVNVVMYGGVLGKDKTKNKKIHVGFYLFNKLDTGLEVHTEVDELPLDAFLLVLLLFQHKHVVVEELLQPLVRVVDAQLLKTVVLAYGVDHLLLVTALSDKLSADLDLRLQQTLKQVSTVDAQKESNLLSLCKE